MHTNTLKLEFRSIAFFIAVLLFVNCVIVSVFHPGFMSFDTLVQYEYAREWRFVDNHPPLFSFVWALLLSLGAGYAGMFLFNLFLLNACVLLFGYKFEFKFIALLFPLAMLFPWVFNFSGVIWKDVTMAYALMLSGILLLLFNEKKWSFPIGIVLLFFAASLRYNSLFAIFPILFLAIKLKFKLKSTLLNLVLSLIVIAAFVSANYYIVYGLLHAEHADLSGFLLADDLSVLSQSYGFSLLPTVNFSDIQKCAIKPIHYERALCFISQGYDQSGNLAIGIPLHDVFKMWLSAVSANPLDLISSKFNAFIYFLRIPSLGPYYYWAPGLIPNPYSLVPSNPGLVDFASTVFRFVPSLFFLPWFWVILNMSLLFCSYLSKSNNRFFYIAMLYSSLLYIASYFLEVPSADFRYAYWTVISTTFLGLFMCISKRSPDLV